MRSFCLIYGVAASLLLAASAGASPLVGVLNGITPSAGVMPEASCLNAACVSESPARISIAQTAPAILQEESEYV
jgi:hypothetical protein